jgi:opacity protein-like surface antigen
MKKSAIVCASLLFLIPAAGICQLSNTFGIGPRMGYYKAKNADDGNFFGGLQVRAHLGKVIGLEGSAAYRTAETYRLDNYAAHIREVPVTPSLLIYIPISDHFEPYALGGFGAYYTFYDYNDDAESIPGIHDHHKVTFGYHLGFGLEIPFTKSVALDADYRYVFLDPNSDTFGEVGDADLSGHMFTAALMFYF